METLYNDDDDDEDDDVDFVAADGFDSNHSPAAVLQFATGFPPIKWAWAFENVSPICQRRKRSIWLMEMADRPWKMFQLSAV